MTIKVALFYFLRWSVKLSIIGAGGEEEEAKKKTWPCKLGLPPPRFSFSSEQVLVFLSLQIFGSLIVFVIMFDYFKNSPFSIYYVDPLKFR